eukprot:scaffold174587_cov20-Prasinocladus_malaysianus.AAC.2
MPSKHSLCTIWPMRAMFRTRHRHLCKGYDDMTATSCCHSLLSCPRQTSNRLDAGGEAGHTAPAAPIRGRGRGRGDSRGRATGQHTGQKFKVRPPAEDSAVDRAQPEAEGTAQADPRASPGGPGEGGQKPQEGCNVVEYPKKVASDRTKAVAQPTAAGKPPIPQHVFNIQIPEGRKLNGKS